MASWRKWPSTRWGHLLLFGAALVAALYFVDGRALAARLMGLDVRWLLPYAVVHASTLVLLGVRWSGLARTCGHDLAFKTATLEYALSVSLNQCLPTGMVGDGSRLLRSVRAGGAFGAVTQGLVLDRVSGQMGLLLAAACAIPLAPPELLGQQAAAFVVFAVVVAVGAALLLRRRYRAVLAARVSGGREAALVLLRGEVLIRHLSLSILLTVALLFELSISAQAAHVPLSLRQLLWFGPLLLLASNLPSAIGSWGVREAAAVGLFSALGADATQGLTVSVTFGLFGLIVSLPGLLVLLHRAGRGERIRHGEPGEGDEGS